MSWTTEQFRIAAPVGMKFCDDCQKPMSALDRHAVCQLCRNAGGYIHPPVGGKKPWTHKEEWQLKADYPHHPTTELAKKYGRSARALNQKAFMLGVKKTPETIARINQATGFQVGALKKRGATHNPAPTPEPWKSPSPAHGATGAQ